MTKETYLKPREAAEYLRSSTSTLAKARMYKRGPNFVRIGHETQGLGMPRFRLQSGLLGTRPDRPMLTTEPLHNSSPSRSAKPQKRQKRLLLALRPGRGR